MVENELIKILNQQLDIELSQTISLENLQEKLSDLIDDLIRNDFQKLVFILYKVDVNENKLKQLLQTNEGENASVIIAKLIIERELQKIESRRQYNSQADNEEFDRW